MKNRNSKWIRLPLKIILWLTIGIFLVIILLVIAMQIPAVQNLAAQKAVSYLKEKLKTEVTLGSINIGFPRTINIEKLYIADKRNDTLLYAGAVNVGIDMLGLLKNRLFIRSVELSQITGNIYRQYPDTTFNYSFILDAFASGDSSVQPGDTTPPMEIDLRNIRFKDIRLSYSDTINGILARVYIGDFNTAFSRFDLNELSFKTDEIVLVNSSVNMLQTPVLVRNTDTSKNSALPDISFKDIILKNFSTEYRDLSSGNHLKGLIGNLELKAESLDLTGRKIALTSFLLSDSEIGFNHTKPQQVDTLIAEVATEQGIEKQVATPEWVLSLSELRFQNNKLNYNNQDSMPKERGIDFNHVEISALNISSDNISIQPGNIKLKLNNFSFSEKSGFKLNEFKSDISYDTTNVTLANLLITTPNTRISDHLEANFSSITKIADSIEKVNIVLELDSTRIGITDVLYFSPEMAYNPKVKIKAGEVMDISGQLSGSLERLFINQLAISNNRATSIRLSGVITNAMNPELMFAEINGLIFKTTSRDIYSYISKDMLPETVTISPSISLTGNFEGYLKNFNSNIQLNSSFGGLNADIKMNPSAGNVETRYFANLTVKELDLGKLLNQPDTLGPVSLQASIDGIGINPDSLNASLTAVVTSAFYNQYTYTGLNVEGFIVNRSFHGEIWMHDNNLDFTYTGYVNMDPDSLAFLFDLDLNGADLTALNLSENELKFSGAISADLAKRYGPNPLGKIKIYDLRLIQAGLDCPVDSIIIQSSYDRDSSIIQIRSVFLNAIMKGEIVIKDLISTVVPHLNRYFEFSARDTAQIANASKGAKGEVPVNIKHINNNDTIVPQNFNFSLTLEDPNLICKNLVPALKRFTPLTLTGKYSSDEQSLVAIAEIPMIDYNNIVIDSLLLNINSDREKLEYKVHAAEISNPSLAIEEFDFRGGISNNKITYRVNVEKADSFNVLRTSGAFAKNDNDYTLILDEPLVLNNTAWNIDPDNKITFSDKGLDAQKVILSGEDQLVSIITQPGENVPLKITFEDFRLANLSLIIEKDKELPRGELNGYFTLFKVNGVNAFTSDLMIDSLKFMDIPVGNISLLADNSRNAEQFDINMTLTGYGNELTVQGNYIAKDSTGILNLDLDIPRLNMAAVEPFTFGQVSRMSGFINGGLAIRGTTANPDINGHIALNEVAFTAPFANTYLRVNNNTLQVRDKKFILDGLTLIDTTNHTAEVKGYADFSDLTNLKFDFRIITEDFLAMNSTRGKKDAPIYGTVLLDSDIRVRGTPSNPVINMQVTLNNGTEVTYMLPETNMTLNESEGIVIFADSITDQSQIMAADSLQQVKSTLEGISLDASITFEPEAVLRMLIDPVAGDSMFVSGEGVLNFSMETGGQMNLSGKYDITGGGYNLTLNDFIKREFTLREGSSITWTGDIMDALVDLTAQYTVKTSPMLLLEDQIQGLEETERGQFRNELTFFVLLKMDGKLTEPEISFEIAQPEDEEGAMGGTVNSKLNELKTDESQMNKQVFALLTLNRFLGQDPFETGNAPMTVESATRSSASKLLTQQFSSLSEKYIKGVDLDVGVTSFEDYSEGEQQGRTQLNLGVSKELFDDRVSVQVGGNVDLEGEHASNNKMSDIAGNVKVEYKLTPNGRYRLKGYRRIEFEDPIEGEIINTGIGISYTRDFRRLRQLFMSQKKREELREQRNAELLDQQKTDNEQP